MSGVNGVTGLLLLQAAATWWMVGLIWFVQVVHYPLLGRVGKPQAADYAMSHQRLTTWVVGPPMLVEAVCVLLLLWMRPETLPLGVVWLGAGLLLFIWLSTALLQVPQHERLGRGFDAAAHRFLVRSNWLRTVAWSARGVLALWMLAKVWER